MNPSHTLGNDCFAIYPSFVVTFDSLGPWATAFDLHTEKNPETSTNRQSWALEAKLTTAGSIQISQYLDNITVLKVDGNGCFPKRAVLFFLP